MHYAFIGLGNLGGHLAASLLKAGFAVTIHDRDPAQRARLEDLGATWADSAALAVPQADAVITCLPSPAVSEAVLDEILPVMRNGADWIEMSTLGRPDILRLAEKVTAAGMGALECPVTGGVHLAAQGNGVALVSELLAGHALETGQVVRAHPATIPGAEGYFIATTSASPIAATFRDWLLSHLAEGH